MSYVDYSIESKEQTKIHTIEWTVPEIKVILADRTNRQILLELPEERTIAEASDSRFQVKLQFMGRGNDLLDIYYRSQIPVFVKFVLKENYRGTCLKDSVYYHTIQALKWQHMCTLYKNELTKILPGNGDLYLNFQFIANEIKDEGMKSPEVQLSNDFENLLNNGMYYDVTMKSVEGLEYKVHKVVLASRSAVLKAHFEHNTTECVTNVVESPLTSEVLREVLTFIYSNKAPCVDEFPEKLLAAADYYQLSGLISLCGEALYKKLTVENAIETLQIADLHSANALKTAILEFIKDEQAMPAIIKTEGWAKLKSTEFIKEIFEYLMADNVILIYNGQ